MTRMRCGALVTRLCGAVAAVHCTCGGYDDSCHQAGCQLSVTPCLGLHPHPTLHAPHSHVCCIFPSNPRHYGRRVMLTTSFRAEIFAVVSDSGSSASGTRASLDCDKPEVDRVVWALGFIHCIGWTTPALAKGCA